MTNKQRIADKLHKLRDANGYTLSSLAIRTGLTKQSLQSYEIGRNGVPIDKLTKIVKVYGYTLASFLEEVENDR